MTSLYAVTTRYERTGDKLTPVLVRSEPDHRGVLRPTRLTELSWSDVPRTDISTEPDVQNWCAIEALLCNDREALLINGSVVPARRWPEGVPYLALDGKGWALAADELAGKIITTIENAWVAELVGVAHVAD